MWTGLPPPVFACAVRQSSGDAGHQGSPLDRLEARALRSTVKHTCKAMLLVNESWPTPCGRAKRLIGVIGGRGTLAQPSTVGAWLFLVAAVTPCRRERGTSAPNQSQLS